VDVKLIVVGGKHPGQESRCRAEVLHRRPRTASSAPQRKGQPPPLRPSVEEGFLAVATFGSKNGTFVNGEQVKAERELKAGDRLRIGPLEFDIQFRSAWGGKKKPKVHNVQEAAARTVQSSARRTGRRYRRLAREWRARL